MWSLEQHSSTVVGIELGIYFDDDVEKLSSVQIHREYTLDELGHPMTGGLCDPAMGPLDLQETCVNCNRIFKDCPGHPGHIQLATSVFNPVTFSFMLKILQSKCLYCHRLRQPKKKKKEFMQFFKEERSSIEKKTALKNFFQGLTNRCSECTLISPAMRNQKKWKIIQFTLSDKSKKHNAAYGVSVAGVSDDDGDNDEVKEKNLSTGSIDLRAGVNQNVKRLVLPTEVEEHFKALWRTRDGKMLQKILSIYLVTEGRAVYEAFFMTNLLVIPHKYRPVASDSENSTGDHTMNVILRKIIRHNNAIVELAKVTESARITDFQDKFLLLQNTVNCLLDIEQNMIISDKQTMERFQGVRQVLDKKEGLFRKNMMGKRVNYAARSVIAPDPYISTDEAGLPDKFAKVLTFPTMVTPFNAEDLRKAVINGSDIYPGANIIEIDGKKTMLKRKTLDERIALSKTLLSGSKPKIVYRHVKDGDVVLANRQPTLHKPGIMAHKVRVLKGEETIRLHYANCNTYNADFDGDEINLHYPQDEIARAEAMLLLATPKQYIVPKNGTPLRGLIQDHVGGAVLLTMKDTFLKKGEYCQFLYTACSAMRKSGKVRMIEPAIRMKGIELWTGKQLITSVLKNLVDAEGLNMIGKAKIKGSSWGKGLNELESVLHVKNGELMHGILDKSQIGASSYGLVHSVYEVYGPEAAEMLLTSLGRLLTSFIQCRRGFTCGIDDLLLHSDSEEKRTKSLEQSYDLSIGASADFVRDLLPEDGHCDPKLISKALKKKFDDAASVEATSKAWDSKVKSELNALTSDVIKTSLDPSSDTSLWKPFPRNNLALMTMSGAKGSNVNQSQISCLIGQQELEGKRVPRTATGKTLPSFPAFDASARAGGFVTGRFLSGIRPAEYYFHCMAGREGLVDTAVKTSRSGYLQRCLVKHLENLKVGYDYTVRDEANGGQVIQFCYGEDCIDVMKTAFLYNKDRFRFLSNNYSSMVRNLNPGGAMEVLDLETAGTLWEEKLEHDTVLSLLNPGRYLGAVSEKFEDLLDEVGDDQFKAMMWLKYLQSLVQPGEPVGVLAAQSIGEPSTQMTLNTFHLAGFGGANVTLGIPRLREIIMTASKSIKTPLMQIKFNSGSKKAAENLGRAVEKITMKDIVCGVMLKEKVITKRHVRSIEIDLEYNFDVSDIPQELFQRIVKMKLVPLLVEHSTEEAVVVSVAEEEPHLPVQNASESQNEEKEEEESDEESGSSSDISDDEEESVLTMDVDDNTESGTADPESKSESIALNVASEMPSNKLTLKNIDYSKEKVVKIVLEMNMESGRSLLSISNVEKCLELCTIRHVKSINGCYIIKGEDGYILQTEGVNFNAMARLGLNSNWDIDINQMSTNDIGAILDTYGVEAARAAIVKEIKSVFAVYGISVDPRHLFLLADYMTAQGGFKPLNRYGIATSDSPFLKMTYETSSNFLTESILMGEKDSLKTVSSSIIAGQLPKVGTGAFDLVQPLAL